MKNERRGFKSPWKCRKRNSLIPGRNAVVNNREIRQVLHRPVIFALDKKFLVAAVVTFVWLGVLCEQDSNANMSDLFAVHGPLVPAGIHLKCAAIGLWVRLGRTDRRDL